MRADTLDWLNGLRDFVSVQQAERPRDEEQRPASEQAAERMILAAQLSTWLTGIDDILSARHMWLDARHSDGDPHPAIVITTSRVGVALAEELTTAGSVPARRVARDLVAVSEREYRLWCIAHPDDHSHRHVTMWNWIKSKVPQQRHAEFAHHRLRDGECYWLHRAGIAGAGSADRRDSHLWKWNGHHAALLEPFVVERNVGRVEGTMPGRQRPWIED